MARTFSDAFEQVAGEDFDLAVGLATEPQEYVVDEQIAANWRDISPDELLRFARQLAKDLRITDVLAEEATSNAFAELLETESELFEGDVDRVFGRAYAYAKREVAKIRYDRAQETAWCISLDGLLDSEEAESDRPWGGPLETASSAVAYTKAGVDEGARDVEPPKPRGRWSRLQGIGALQRFRDEHGRAPGSRDFTAANGLPPWRTFRAFGFKTINDALLEAGIPLERPPRRDDWTPFEAAKACLWFRRRYGYWPGSFERLALPSGCLPNPTISIKFLGGNSSTQTQMGCEAILGPIDQPTWKPTGELTRRLRAERRRDA